MTSYSGASVGQALIDLKRELNDRQANQLTPYQLQAMVYIANGLHHGILGSPLVDEKPFAYGSGPIFKILNSSLSMCEHLVGYNHLRHRIKPIQDAAAKEIIEVVMKAYGDMTDIELKAILMDRNGPWYQSIARQRFSEISDYVLANYYKTKHDALYAYVADKSIEHPDSSILNINVEKVTIEVSYDVKGFIKNDPVADLMLSINIGRHKSILNSNDNANMKETGLTVIRSHVEDYVLDVIYTPELNSYEYRILDADGTETMDRTSWDSDRAAYAFGLQDIESMQASKKKSKKGLAR